MKKLLLSAQPYLISVPVLFDDPNGLPESAGVLHIRPVVAALLADGILRMEAVVMRIDGQEPKLMEIKLVPAHEQP